MSFDWDEANEKMRDLQKLQKLNEINENLKRNQPPSRPFTREENAHMMKWFFIIFGICSVACVVMVFAFSARP